MTIIEQLEEIKSRKLYRDFKVLETFQDVKVLYCGETVHLMGSNNYLSLNNHPEINAYTKKVIDAFGTGAGGSRLTTGTTTYHEKLERQLAAFKKSQSALLFGSGYMANLGVISGITDETWCIFSDRHNHASIIDGIMLSKAHLERYRHLNLADLERRLRKSSHQNKMVITDSVFSMDGTIAPIAEISQLCQAYNALLVVDDAHGFGVLGHYGRGISELAEEVHIDLTIGTLSKAVPASGGYVIGNRQWIDLIKNTARSFIFSTALPAHVVASSIKAVELIERDTDRRMALKRKIAFFVNMLNSQGFNIVDRGTPIIPIIIGDPEKTIQLQERLLEDGILIPGIRPPTVPKGTSRLRASINYNHQYDDLRFIAERIVHHSIDLGIVR